MVSGRYLMVEYLDPQGMVIPLWRMLLAALVTKPGPPTRALSV